MKKPLRYIFILIIFFSWEVHSKCLIVSLMTMEELFNEKMLEGVVVESTYVRKSILDLLFSKEPTEVSFKLELKKSIGIITDKKIIKFKYSKISDGIKEGTNFFAKGDHVAIFVDGLEDDVAIVQHRPCEPMFIDLKKKDDLDVYNKFLLELEKRNTLDNTKVKDKKIIKSEAQPSKH